MNDAMHVFDRRLLRRRRERAAPNLAGHDFLFQEAAERLADRLADVKRRFPLALDLGCRDGSLSRKLEGRGGTERLVQCDPSFAMAARASAAARPSLVADEEFLPFAAGSFDLVLSCLNLHWTNDLPGALLQVRQALKPDGLFLAVQFGLGTLAELREALLEAEAEARGGAALRVSPFADARDAAGLLQRAGFALPVADAETLTVTYPNALALMRDLRGMGETSAPRDRARFAGRAVFARAAQIYEQRFAAGDGRVPASFRLLFLTGWAPHGSQQRPQRPGSAAARLAEALHTIEHSAGDKAKP